MKSKKKFFLACRYRVLHELGRGGMGIVYLCYDEKTDKHVALKRIESQRNSTTKYEQLLIRNRFEQEVQALALLNHPTLVRALDFGQLEDGSFFIVMDVIPGKSVYEWIISSTLSWKTIWMLVDQVLAGLAHAHARGIIHADLKPSNILLDLSHNDKLRAYVLDLGLAWLRSSKPISNTSTTPLFPSLGGGTVGWLAPEQIRGSFTLVGPPTDIYAVGCIVYRLLTGKELFEGEANNVLRAHKREPIPSFEIPKEVPHEVIPLVKRMLAKKPWHRFQFAADVRQEWKQMMPSDAVPFEVLIAKDKKRIQRKEHEFVSPSLSALLPAPLVGKKRKQDQLLKIAEQVREKREFGSCMSLLTAKKEGEESRLAEWLCEQVYERGWMETLRAHYTQDSHLTHGVSDGLVRAVNTYFHLNGADRALVEQTLIARWEVQPQDRETLNWIAALVEWLRPTPSGEVAPLTPTAFQTQIQPQDDCFYTYVACEVLRRLSQQRPLLVWIDHLHLAPPHIFEVLEALAKHTTSTRLLVVGTLDNRTHKSNSALSLFLKKIEKLWKIY
ncbi:serine/threonine-protein kinase [Pajaroellobacter abortibovis]|uniref:Protein kinase domain-containing protein n=1 Tax=Pajaroellobacter abortibovis TaxID=1882918 RepID=A0A1L6MX22_9BACT|nr:serine/threonine-protein kinase [Pajaroellobacter abortibovis]APS00084.1 hypothetical protein BCY86_04865 [Pajaroellobacter abortibovis]